MKNWQTYLEMFCALPSIVLDKIVDAARSIYADEKELLKHPEEEFDEDDMQEYAS